MTKKQLQELPTEVLKEMRLQLKEEKRYWWDKAHEERIGSPLWNVAFECWDKRSKEYDKICLVLMDAGV